MPEGHTLHRYAGLLRPDLMGERIAASSPQGRFSTEAAQLDGGRVVAVEAYGKNLLVDAEPQAGDEPLSVHVHLGLRGLFLRYDDPGASPRPGTRLRVASRRAAYDLIAPSRCMLLDGAGRAAVLAKLGPDPLRPESDGSEAVRRLTSARGSVAEALLDQGVLAGVGNVYRAEVLYLHRLDPRLPARDVPQTTYEGLWETLRSVMARGVRVGHILTADVADDTTPEEGRYVYKRAVCLGCGGPVRAWDVASRTVYACEREQLDGGGRATP
ncbi:MAG: hypothetical protein M3P95_04990 [Actinomycetota bacterium]|nr:hypothetical protein [Actinomycetota bacterium]